MQKYKIIIILIFTIVIFWLILINTSYYRLKTLYKNPLKINQIYKEYSYDEYSNHITIRTYNGNEKEVIIPEYINNKPVYAIDDSAFYGNDKIESVTIPKHVLRIGHQSFIGCANLKEVILPNKVIDIGSWAFKGCPNLKKIYVKKISKTHRTLKKSPFKKYIYYKNISS